MERKLSPCPCGCGTHGITEDRSNGYLTVVGSIRFKAVPTTQRRFTPFKVQLFSGACGEGKYLAYYTAWDCQQAFALAEKMLHLL